MRGRPVQRIADAAGVRHAALVGEGCGHEAHHGRAVRGRRGPGASCCSRTRKPWGALSSASAGRVKAIHRCSKRVLRSLEIEVRGDAAEEFAQAADGHAGRGRHSRREVVETWSRAACGRPCASAPTASRRPSPHSLFVTAMDSNPLAADPAMIIA